MTPKKKTQTPSSPDSPDAFIGDDQVVALVRFSKKQIPKLVAAGVIPPPINVGTGKKGERHRRRWHRGHFLQWLRERAERVAEAAE